MPTINGRACVVNGTPVDKVFSNGRQVYGRNLVSGTGLEYTMGYGIPNTVWQDGYAYLKLPTTIPDNRTEILPGYPGFYYNLTSGQVYTQTIWIETDATVKDLNGASISWFNNLHHDYQPANIQKLFNSSYKVISTYTWPDKGTANRVRLFDTNNLDGAFDLSTGTYLKFGKLKLEKGATATPWTPAPEDVGVK